jgi:hypothetical protein
MEDNSIVVFRAIVEAITCSWENNRVVKHDLNEVITREVLVEIITDATNNFINSTHNQQDNGK